MTTKENKTFVRMMILTASLALLALLVAMFMGIRFFVSQQTVVGSADDLPAATPETMPVEVYATITGVIESVEGDQLYIWDVEKKQTIVTELTDGTDIKDAYDNYIPRAALERGELVTLQYAASTDKLLEISISADRWKKTDVKNYEIDRAAQTVTIGNSVYDYNAFTLVWQGEERISTYLIGEYDTITFIGSGSTVYAMILEDAGAYVAFENLPIEEGRIEIDRNRVISAEHVSVPIPVTVGTHQIVVYLEGYEPLFVEIEAFSEETTTIDLSTVVQKTTKLQMNVANVLQYEIDIEGKSYGTEKEIALPYGKYNVTVTAEGYQPFKAILTLEEPTLALMVTLTKETEAGQSQEGTPGTGDTSTGQGSDSTNNGMYEIWLATEPDGAKVFINGTAKGVTPLKITLGLGDYNVTFEKEGYETYITSLIIDNSDNQHNYYYVLTPTS